MRTLVIFALGGAASLLVTYVGIIIYFIRNGNPT